jgi:hypothetical protein
MGGPTGRRRLGYATVPRRAAAMAAAAITFCLLTAGPALAAPLAPAGTPLAPSVVAAELGANKVPAELVVLVDISLSMSVGWNGLYPEVQQELPRFLGALARQDPQDTVAVVVFGTMADTQTVYLGPPTPNINLPSNATSDGTDFGYAFQTALTILSQAPSSIKVGGVLLLSDGELNAVGDPPYNGYSAPGWAKLRAERQSLGMTVTGYGLPLTTNPANIDGVRQALQQVFASNDTLSQNFTDLSQQLATAEQKILDSRVGQAARQDSGHGIQATWHDLPGHDGTPPLNLGLGHADVRLTLTAATHHVPLTMHVISLESRGFPVPISGTLPGQNYTLAAGRSVTVPVQLTWPPYSGGNSLFGGSASADGQLVLRGAVTSGATAAIRNTFGDTAFSVGGLVGHVSAPFPATASVGAALGLWILIAVVLVALILILGGFRARLSGALSLDAVDHRAGPLTLPRRPWAYWATDDLIRKRGRILIIGNPVGRGMRIWVRLDEEGMRKSGALKPNGHKMIAGISFVHRTGSPVPSATAAPSSRRGD